MRGTGACGACSLANLMDDAGRSVLLDWFFTGDGAAREDVASLIVDSFTDGLMDVARLPG